MSVWTHAAGVIRVDSLRFKNAPKPDWNELIGRPSLWGTIGETERYLEAHPEQRMPCGSEGSLNFTVWENPDEAQIPSYVVSVFGDLRDYDDPDAVIEWFKEVCSRLWVRNAVIEADCGDGNPRVWSWTRDSETETECGENISETEPDGLEEGTT